MYDRAQFAMYRFTREATNRIPERTQRELEWPLQSNSVIISTNARFYFVATCADLANFFALMEGSDA